MNDNGTINKVILVGKISQAPRWHKSENGQGALCFGLVTREYFLQKGQRTEHIEEHALRLTGNKAEYGLMPGQWVHIEGRLKTTAFSDQQAVRRYKTEIIVSRLCTLDICRESGEQPMP